MDIKTILTIFHLIGLALGAGAAYLSDIMFFSTIKDRTISSTELSFLRLTSRIVWIGLGVLFISGLALFLLKPAVYLASSKFMVKITIVAILTLNGIFFHHAHIPMIDRHKDAHLPSSDEFIRRRRWLLYSGVISMTSWTSALILGAIRSIPYSYTTGLTIYFSIVIIGLLIAEGIKHHLFPHHQHSK